MKCTPKNKQIAVRVNGKNKILPSKYMDAIFDCVVWKDKIVIKNEIFKALGNKKDFIMLHCTDMMNKEKNREIVTKLYK